MSMSTTTTIQAEASKPQKKMQECNRCKAAGFPNQLIGFEKIGEDPVTGKINWKLIDENGEQHKHKSNNQDDYSSSNRNEKPVSQRRRVVDLSTVTDVEEARKLLSSGWEYKTSYAANDR